jgi:hypothetical protein
VRSIACYYKFLIYPFAAISRLFHLTGQYSTDKRALEISSSIISAHTKRERVLTGDHYETMRALLTDRIRWLRNLGRPEHHTAALDWCTVLHALMCENVDERSSCASLLVVQSDSLLRLHRMPEAVTVATQAWQTLPNTRTIVMRFTAIMHAEAAVNNTAKVANEEAVEAAVLALREMHRTDTTMTSAGPASAPAFTMTEQLARIILCCQMAQQSEQLPELTRDATSQRLLVEWLQLYTDHTAWRSTSTATENDAVNCLEPADGVKDQETTYFGVVCDMLHLFFKHRLSHTLRSGKPAVTATCYPQPAPATAGKSRSNTRHVLCSLAYHYCNLLVLCRGSLNCGCGERSDEYPHTAHTRSYVQTTARYLTATGLPTV